MKKNILGCFLLVGAIAGCGDSSPSNDLNKPAQWSETQTDVTAVANIIRERCSSCHSETPTDDVFKVAPGGVILDNLDQMQRYSARIFARAVATQTMPFMNKTAMTEQERSIIGQWIKADSPSK